MAVRQQVESGWLSPRRAGAVVVVAAAGGSWRLAAARVGIVWRCLRWRMAQGAALIFGCNAQRVCSSVPRALPAARRVCVT